MVLVAAAALQYAAALDCNCSAPPANLHAYDSLIIGDATATAYGREAARINLACAAAPGEAAARCLGIPSKQVRYPMAAPRTRQAR